MSNEELHKAYENALNQVQSLRQQIEWLKKQLYGRKSEKLNHPELFALDEQGKSESSGAGDAPEEQKPNETGTQNSPKTPRKIRENRLPDDLPVVFTDIIPEEVKAAPELWREVGYDERTILEKEPGYFYLSKTRRFKFVLLDEPFSPPVIESAKPTIIDNGFWGPDLLAEILVNKYLYHIPFDRQHVLTLQRYGIDLSPKTMGDAAAKVSGQVELLIQKMKLKMLSEGYVRADETFVRYLERKNEGSSQGYLWVYRGVDGDVIFDWQTSREHKHVAEWLGGDFQGILQADGYQAYMSYCRAQLEAGRNVRLAACLAHVRRKFVEARVERPEVVDWILKIICQLYQIEKDLRNGKADAKTRQRVRQNRARRKIELLGKAFKKLMITAIRPKSRLGQALQYAVGQWPQMAVYLEDGRVEIDNNATENDIRPSAVGKKNWLFMGSAEAGNRAAAMYTLLLSARNHGVNPQAYLKDVIERLPQMKSNDPALEELLPSEWAKVHRESHPAVKSQRAKVA